jgi:hypothetical protein
MNARQCRFRSRWLRARYAFLLLVLFYYNSCQYVSEVYFMSVGAQIQQSPSPGNWWDMHGAAGHRQQCHSTLLLLPLEIDLQLCIHVEKVEAAKNAE